MNFDHYIFCDASFSPKYKIAVIGHVNLNSISNNFNNNYINTKIINCENCNRAEIKAFLYAFKEININQKTLVFTDCQTLCKLPERRAKLENSNYISKATKKTLANADLYKEFFNLFDKFYVELKWIKGHKSKSIQNETDQIFSRIDKMTRTRLRDHLNNLTNCDENT